MKLWLDDVRTPPDAGWVWVKDAPACIQALQAGVFQHLSLDHDLGPEEAGTGYAVLCWMEEEVHEGRRVAPRNMVVHSANPVGRGRMIALIARIQAMVPARRAAMTV
jgi:hypothetical protein